MAAFRSSIPHAGRQLELEPSYGLIGFRSPMLRTTLADSDFRGRLADFGISLLGIDERRSFDTPQGRAEEPTRPTINASPLHYWIVSETGEPLPDETEDRIRGMLADDLDYLGPVYRTPGSRGVEGLLCLVPNVVLLRAREDMDDALEQLIADLDLGLVEDEDRSRLTHRIRLRHFRLESIVERTAYDVRDLLLEDHGDVVEHALLQDIPLVRAYAFVPDDGTDPGLFYQAQWALPRIDAEQAWDIERGDPSVFVCVLDDGVLLNHPDLSPNLPDGGVDASVPGLDADVVDPTLEWHGTRTAGVAAARMNNAQGIAGVAGQCSIYPVKFGFDPPSCAAGITAAVDFAGAVAGRRMVISMSFGWQLETIAIDTTSIDLAIEAAVAQDCLLCAAVGNGEDSFGDPYDVNHNLYPARHPAVVACGASDKLDVRWDEAYGDKQSHKGMDVYAGQQTGVSVVAPGQGVWTTSVHAARAGGAPIAAYAPSTGTSFAAPHVAALGALLMSRYGLSALDCRAIIERTTQKIGEGATYTYADHPDFPNGTRHVEVGYGRINAFQALDFADVMIRDWPGDLGIEPSLPPGGDYWSTPDIVVRPNDDDVFVPDDAVQASQITRGQDNWLYVRVRNAGPASARNVQVSARITPWVGVDFAYPNDWTDVDDTHVAPEPVSVVFANLAAGNQVIAKFRIKQADVEALWGWTEDSAWSPSILVEATADNDYAWSTVSRTGPSLLTRRNNLAQRSVSVVEGNAGRTVRWPIAIGHEFDDAFDIRLLIAFLEISRRLPPGPPKPPVWLEIDTIGLPSFARLAARGPGGFGVGGVWSDLGDLHEDDGRRVTLVGPRTRVVLKLVPRYRHELRLCLAIPDDAEPGDVFSFNVLRDGPSGVRGGSRVVFRVRG